VRELSFTFMRRVGLGRMRRKGETQGLESGERSWAGSTDGRAVRGEGWSMGGGLKRG